MDRRFDDYDAMLHKKSDRRYIEREEKLQSRYNQFSATISHESSRPTSEVTYYSRKQSGIAKNYYSVPYHKRERSSAAKHHDLESNGETTKLLVSNVHFKVTDWDILLLFGEFKSLQFSRVKYDRSGCPLGSAELVFGKRADAMKAIELYNGAKLDGRRLNIQVATPDVLATYSRFKNTVKFIPVFEKLKNYNKQPTYRYGWVTKSYKHQRTTVEELDAELDQIVEARQKILR